jgi:putative ABC transport system permease protein
VATTARRGSWWRQLTRGLRVLIHREAADRDVADEVQHYLEEATAALVANGLAPEQARRAALLEIGNTTVMSEQVRAYGWETLVSTSIADLRFAARRLRSTPGFAAVAVLTLALGIGASTAIFSAVSPILFEPLPYPQPGRIVTVWDYGVDGARVEVTFGTYRELAERSRAFDALAVMKPWQPTLTGAAEPERLDGQRVSAAYFRALGVRPVLGREFSEAEDRANGPNTTIVSDGLWRRRLSGDIGIVGHQITLNDTLYTVVGVMPAGFENVASPAAEIWAPMQYDASLPPNGREWGHHLQMIGRMREGIVVDRAKHDLDAIAQTPVPEFRRRPWASLRQGVIVNPLQEDVTRGVKPALLAVVGAVLLVLAIACVNVTNLLLARGAQRRGEFAMRTALGAGRARLIRQLLTESLLLAALGGALGMVVAEFGVRALVALSPPGLPRVNAIRVDGAILAFGMVVTAIVGLAFGLFPALQASRRDVHAAVQHTSPRTAGGHYLIRRTLVIVQVALALVLLVSAGLLFRSLNRLFAVDPGFEPARVLTMQVQASGRRFSDLPTLHRFFDSALDAVRTVPGVSDAAFTNQLPLSGDLAKYGVRFESIPNDNPNEDGSALRYAVSPGYFEALGIPLRRGRLLDAHDTATAPHTVVISESLAKRKLPGQEPLGQRMHIGDPSGPWYSIVGVVGDVKHTSLALAQADAVYTTIAQWPLSDNPLSLVVRQSAAAPPVRNSAPSSATALAPAVRAAIWSVDKDQPVVRVATLEGLVAASAAERRFALILFEVFALVALALAATGIYGVLSGSVTERMREIGVRSALGASRTDILALVMRQGMMLAGIGVVIGLAGAAAASHALVTLLFGVSRLDPVTYLGVIGLLAGVSGIACGLPAWRAARVDPSVTLRAE